MAANAAVYDTAVVTDVTGSAFSDAVTVLTSIEAGPVRPRVPVTEAMRRQAYEVSPAAAELRESLEAPDNKWRGIGCPGGCADFSGGWWMWALRDAVAEAGYYRDAPTAAAFYQRITDELQDACESGRLTCRSSAIPFMPHLTEAQWRELPARFVDAAGLLVMRDGTMIPAGASADPLPWLQDVRSFLNDPPSTLSPSEDHLVVTGWFHDPEGGWLQLDCRAGGRRTTVDVERLDSADVAAILGASADRNRFALDLDLDQTCDLRATSSTGTAASVSLADLVAQGPSGRLLGTATLQVEAASAVRGDTPPTWARTIVDRLAVVYGWLLPFLVAGGVLGWLVGVVRLRRGRRSHAPLLVVALVAWTLVATRSAILVLVDVTSFDAVHAGYMTAGFPLTVIAAMAGLASALVRERPHGSAPGPVAASSDGISSSPEPEAARDSVAT
jgi:hypothetical protein